MNQYDKTKLNLAEEYHFVITSSDLTVTQMTVTGDKVEEILQGHTIIIFRDNFFSITEGIPTCVASCGNLCLLNTTICKQMLPALTGEECPNYDSLHTLLCAVQRLFAGIVSSYIIQCPKTGQSYKIEVNAETLDNLIEYVNDMHEPKFPLSKWFMRI